MSKNQLILYTLAGLNFTHIVDVMIMMPLGDIFMRLFDIGPTEFSFLLSSYAIAAFISSLIGAVYLDRFDRRKALVFLYCGFVLATVACGFTNSFMGLLSFRFLTGFFGGTVGALVLSIVSDRYKFKERGKALGVLMAAFSAASALGVPFGLFLTDQFSWRWPFFFLGIIGAILALIMIFNFPKMSDHLQGEQPDRSLKGVTRAISTDFNQINALILGFVLVFGHYVIIPFITPYMTRNVGFLQSEITYIYLLGGILTVFSSPYIGKMTDRYGAMKIFSILVVLSFIPVVWLTNLGPSSLAMGLTVTSLFFVLGSGRMISPQTMITAAVGPANRASFMSVKSAMQQMAIALAALLGGVIVSLDADEKLTNYWIIGIISIVVCLWAVAIAKKLKVAEGN